MNVMELKRSQLENLARHREHLRTKPHLRWLFFEITNCCNLHCKGIYFKDDKYCRYCGAPMGKPEYIEKIIRPLYGPPPVKRVHTCAKCGYSWESYSMIDNVHYCPKCGGDTVKLISKED